MANSWRSSKEARVIDYNHLGYNKPDTVQIAQVITDGQGV